MKNLSLHRRLGAKFGTFSAERTGRCNDPNSRFRDGASTFRWGICDRDEIFQRWKSDAQVLLRALSSGRKRQVL